MIHEVTASVYDSLLLRSYTSDQQESAFPDFSAFSAVCIATAYGLDDGGVGVQVPVGSRMFSSPHRPDRLWGLPSLLSNGYRGLFPRG
jgi:hypothetical protein